VQQPTDKKSLTTTNNFDITSLNVDVVVVVVGLSSTLAFGAKFSFAETSKSLLRSSCRWRTVVEAVDIHGDHDGAFDISSSSSLSS
jgi:hypothetical protein